MSRLSHLSQRLVRDGYDLNAEYIPTTKDLEEWKRFREKQDIIGSEGWFLPEDTLYPKVLSVVGKDDIVLDLGAGNLALDLLLAERVKKVYAVELNPTVVQRALLLIGLNLPRNLIVVCGNALDFPIPEDVTTLIILMRHFQHTIPKKWLDVRKLILNVYGNFMVVGEPKNE